MSPTRSPKRDRAVGRQRYAARRAGDFDLASVADAAAKAAEPPTPKTGRGRARALPKGFPVGDVRRWVPIGPSVARRGQANGRPRVSGRIRDLAVSPDGTRAYAASAMGGLWYTEDGGSSWDPVGGWADRAARSGGANNAQSCGCLLVDFGAAPSTADDFVLVGTGEGVPSLTAAGEGSFGGLGVLSSRGPAARPVGDNPWEPEAGQGVLEGLGVFRLARDPASTVGRTAAPGTDRVLAATSAGLFLGTRTHVAVPLPERDEFSWVKLPGIDTLVPPPPPPPPVPTPAVTDVIWLPGGAQGRIVVALNGLGVAFSDDAGQNFAWVTGCNLPVSGTGIQGRSSLALAPGTNRLYVLTALPPPPAPPAPPPDVPALFQVADITVAAPAAVQVGNVPPALWGGQRDYDQAITVDVVAGVDRVYLGGSFFDLGQTDFGASLWCFDVGAGPALGPTTGVSRVGAPAPPPPPPEPAGSGEGADRPGHIGNNVHADVHAIRLAGAAPNRQVWVGCDGGVYVSTQAGRVNTFSSRATGLAALQAGFVAAHPTSSHFVAAGFQDNGTQVRSGDTLWEVIFVGDGGGLVFHPRRSDYIVGQFVCASWSSAPPGGFVGPTSRAAGGGIFPNDREDQQGVSEFYSGASAIATPPAGTRIALGTNRVWVTDNLGVAATNRWRVLPYPNGALTDPRPNGNDPAAQQTAGVPAGGGLGALGPSGFVGVVGLVGPLGGVVTVKWSSPTTLLALFQQGVVEWVENPPGQWTATVLVQGAAIPGSTVLTDLAPAPGTQDFYLTTTGDPANTATDTCYLFDRGTGALVGTGLRSAMNPAPPPPGVFGPLDPAYSVVVDPAVPTDVYVGTVTAVWRGVRTAATTNHAWPRPSFVNGLPQAAVQDLSIWTDPGDPAGPRLLRAAVQARGVWEVDLAAAAEPVRTYLRIHPRDDRRKLPTPMANPRRRPTSAPEPVFESPDVTVRPRQDPAAAPRWGLGGGSIVEANAPAYQLWTFQTAFRWHYPSVVPTGMWTDSFGDLVARHRAQLRLPAGAFVDRALWDAVVGGTRLAPDGSVSNNAAHPLAVYRPAWQTQLAMQAVASEVDLLETVQPRSVAGGVWRVFKEPCTVDVLLHHRDTRPVPAGSAFAMVLWRSGPAGGPLLTANATDIVNFAVTAAAGNPPVVPAGWTMAGPVAGGALNLLTVPLTARLPRAVPVDIDLTAVPTNHRVLLLAVAGSTVDPCTSVPVGLPANPTVSDLVRSWPYAALRLVHMNPRP